MKTLRLKSILCGTILSLPFFSTAQVFTEVPSASAALVDFVTAGVTWGDYDNDGDLDLLMTGWNGSVPPSKLYRNDAGTFTDININLPTLLNSSAAWGDYDNDGDLDILLTGQDDLGVYTRVYRNDGGAFTDINANLLNVTEGSVAWGDYDNDGDLDILLTGDIEGNDIPVSAIYRNDAGTFWIHGTLLSVANGTAVWGDYDHDGDLDILLSGEVSSPYGISIVYRNDAGIFTDINAGLPDLIYSSAAWGDYDNDGDLDILLNGFDGGNVVSEVYRNDAGTFVDLNAGLAGAYLGDVAWGDYDNDGNLDIVLTGATLGGPVTKVYRNVAGVFNDINAGLVNVYGSSAAWGDYDNDGDLDIVITGDDDTDEVSKLYRNNTVVANTPPAPPSSFGATLLADTAIWFTWTAAHDGTTPQLGLSYRLWIGTATDSFNVSAPMADTATGWRRIAAIGNIQGTGWTLQDVTLGETYFACVSTIDAGFMGSPCSNATSMLVGMEDGSLGSSFLVTAGPNPTTDLIHVSLQGHSMRTGIQYALTNVEGQELAGFSGEMEEELQLDLSGLPSGMYLLNLHARNSQRIESLKIIKQ